MGCLSLTLMSLMSVRNSCRALLFKIFVWPKHLLLSCFLYRDWIVAGELWNGLIGTIVSCLREPNDGQWDYGKFIWFRSAVFNNQFCVCAGLGCFSFFQSISFVLRETIYSWRVELIFTPIYVHVFLSQSFWSYSLNRIVNRGVTNKVMKVGKMLSSIALILHYRPLDTLTRLGHSAQLNSADSQHQHNCTDQIIGSNSTESL